MTQNIDWDQLGFNYYKTKSHIQYTFKNGSWDEGKLVEGEFLNIHICATCLHYGQAAFEGLKAFRCQDGKIRTFRLEENAARLNQAADRILMPHIPEEMFTEAVKRVVQDNSDFVPPYESGGSMYIRPLLIGTGPAIGVVPSPEYTFIVLVMPVGDYYKGGLQSVPALIQDGFDRAAPQGVGNVKVAGNYAAGLYPGKLAKEKGFPITLHLDPQTHDYIDEFGTSNFVGITKDNKYITPNSSSILPSITNKSLKQLATDLGITVESRPVSFSELGEFKEVGACGTAVIITPISQITRGETTFNYQQTVTEDSVLKQLYDRLRQIQYGFIEDTHNWMTEIC